MFSWASFTGWQWYLLWHSFFLFPLLFLHPPGVVCEISVMLSVIFLWYFLWHSFSRIFPLAPLSWSLRCPPIAKSVFTQVSFTLPSLPWWMAATLTWDDDDENSEKVSLLRDAFNTNLQNGSISIEEGWCDCVSVCPIFLKFQHTFIDFLRKSNEKH